MPAEKGCQRNDETGYEAGEKKDKADNATKCVHSQASFSGTLPKPEIGQRCFFSYSK
jgi:hypothetical protein